MIRKIFIFFLFFLTFTALSGNSDMAVAQDYYTLSNGFQIVVNQDQRFPLVSIRLYVRAGSAHEKPGQEGISHFVEHMVFKGTEQRGPGQVAREIEEVGGNINAGTSLDYTVYIIDLPAHHWKLGLEILHDMIFGSVFDPDELNQEINVVLAEIQRSLDNPGSRLFKSIQSMAFQGTPYEHPVLGFKETVQSFDRDVVQEYVARKYQPQSMVLALSGNVEADRVLEQTRQLFGDLENKTVQGLPSPLKLADRNIVPARRVTVEQGPWNKVYMALAAPAPRQSSPMTPAFDILAYLLGGDKTSLLYREFKYGQGLVDQISAQVLSLERTGLMYFFTRMDPDGVESFWNQFMDRLTSLSQADFTTEQINRAVTNIEDSIFRSRETLGGTASKLGFYQLFEGDPEAEEKYLHNLRRVTREDLQNIIDRYLCPGSFVISALTPEQVAIPADMFKDSLAQPAALLKNQEHKVSDHSDRLIDLGHDRKLVIRYDPHLPHTSITIAWPGGNSIVPRDQQGLPELAAGTLTRETRHRSFEEIQAFLRDRASSITASSARNEFRLSARFPEKYSQDILDLVSEVIMTPAFSDTEFQKAASDQIADIRQQEDRPLGYAFRHLFPFLFSSGPYSYLHLGEEEFILAAEPGMAGSFWQKQKRMPFVISVCGSIDEHALDSFVARMTEIKPLQKEIDSGFAWSDQKTKDLVLRDRTQAHILMVFPIPGKTHEHTPGLKVMNKVLAGQGGILFRELRDRQGLAYSVTSLMWQTLNTGFLALYIGTYEDRVDEAIEGFEQTIADLKAEVLQNEEVDRAANLMFGEYHRGRQTISSRAAEAASLTVQGLDLDFKLEMTESARQVTPEELQTLAIEYLNPDNSYLMRVLPR